MQPLLNQAGYDVTVASDAEAALALHARGEIFQLILVGSSQRGAAAKKLAAAIGLATAWRQTPLLGLGLETFGAQSTPLAPSTVLDAVSETLAHELKGAA